MVLFPYREQRSRLVHVIAKRTLRQFWERHADAREALEAWWAQAAGAAWDSPADIREMYPTASFLRDSRVVFNIRGNHYRLVAKVQYQSRLVFVRFVGTHAEYDQIDAETV